MMRSVWLLACLALAALHSDHVDAQLQITRNTDDCLNPVVGLNAIRLYPSSKYMITGSKIEKLADGGTKITSKAGFSVTYYNTYKVVTNDVAKETYVLYQCGSGAPAPGMKNFEIPLRSISSDDTSASEFLKQTSAVDRVAYASIYASSGCYQALTACGYVAPDPLFAKTDAADIANQVDAFFTFSAVPDNSESVSMSAPAGLDPLLRSEWLKFVAAFMNKEYEAEILYKMIRNNFNSLKRAAQTAADALPKKKVAAWVYLGWNADFVVSKAPYKVAYLESAGGAAVSDDALKAAGFTVGADGWSWSLPQIYVDKWAALLAQVDVIIDESYVPATGGYTRLTDLVRDHKIGSFDIPPVKAGEVYTVAGTTGQTIQGTGDPSVDNTVGLDWYERAVSRCDEVLRDFVKVLTPSTDNSRVNNWKLKWLLKLPADGSQATQYKVLKDCPNATAKLDALCRRVPYPVAICPNAVRNCTTGNLLYPSQDKRCATVSAQKAEIRNRNKLGLTPECFVK